MLPSAFSLFIPTEARAAIQFQDSKKTGKRTRPRWLVDDGRRTPWPTRRQKRAGESWFSCSSRERYDLSGRIGQALGTDGSNDYVNAGSAASLDNIQAQGGGGMTVSLWLYVKSYVVVNPHLIAKPDVNTTAGRWGIRIESGTARFRFFKDFNGPPTWPLPPPTILSPPLTQIAGTIWFWLGRAPPALPPVGSSILITLLLSMSNTNATLNSGPVSTLLQI